MKFTLFDYQDEATANVLVNLRKARKRWHEDGDRHAVMVWLRWAVSMSATKMIPMLCT